MKAATPRRLDTMDYIAITASVLGILAIILLILKTIGVL